MTSLPFGSKHNLTVIGARVVKESLTVAATCKRSLHAGRSWRSCATRAAIACAPMFVLLAAIVSSGCKVTMPEVEPIAPDMPLAGVAGEAGKLEARLDVIADQAETITGEKNEQPKQTIITQAEAGREDLTALNGRLENLKAEIEAKNVAASDKIAALETRVATITDDSFWRFGQWVKAQFEWIAAIAIAVLRWSVYILIVSSVLRVVAAVVPGPWGKALAIASHVGFAIGTGGLSLPLTVGEWLWQWVKGRREVKA
jgi:hypothetical protein